MLRWVEVLLEIVKTMFDELKVSAEVKAMLEKQLERVKIGLQDAQQLCNFFSIEAPSMLYLLWAYYHFYIAKLVALSVLSSGASGKVTFFFWFEREKKIDSLLEAVKNLSQCAQLLTSGQMLTPRSDPSEESSNNLSGSLGEVELEENNNNKNNNNKSSFTNSERSSLVVSSLFYVIVDMFAVAFAPFGDEPTKLKVFSCLILLRFLVFLLYSKKRARWLPLRLNSSTLK